MKKKVLFGGLIIGMLLMFSSAGAASGMDANGNPIDISYATSSICSNTSMENLPGIINWATCTLMKSVVPLLVGLAIVGFVYGIIKYFLNPDNEEKKKEGKNFMLWGLIALFVMVSIWGLVGILSNTFTPGHPNPVIPGLPQ